MPSDPVYREFSPDKLWRVMTRKKITPLALKEALKGKVAPRTIGKWLLDEAQPRPVFLAVLAEALGVKPSDLQDDPPRAATYSGRGTGFRA